MAVKEIEPHLCTVYDYFLKNNQKNEYFVIPEYQRSYTWEIGQCDKLVDDIETFISEGAEDPYFFGTIILNVKSEKMYLIDGQQRTTTFYLLLKALEFVIGAKLKNFVEHDEDSEFLKEGLKGDLRKIQSVVYKTNDEGILKIKRDPALLDQLVLIENNSINEPEINKKIFAEIVRTLNFDDLSNLAKENEISKPKLNKISFFSNFKYFYDRLSKYGESSIHVFAQKLLDKCQLIVIRSWNIEQAIAMFNSLNSKGLPLSDADIISAAMYANIVEEPEKKEFVEKWGFIREATKDGSDLKKGKILDIDGVLQQYMYIYRAENRVYMSINSETPNVTTPGVRKFYEGDKGSLLKNPLVLCDSFKTIVNLWLLIKDYSIVKLLLKFNVNAKLYLVSYLFKFCRNDGNGDFDSSAITEELVASIAVPLLRLFAILEIVDAGYSSNKFKTFLFKENIKLVDPRISISEIDSDFNNHINDAGNWQRDDLKRSLLFYERNPLVYLNEYLYARNHGKKFILSDSVNIEHIMPASGKNIAVIRKDAGINDVNEFAAIVNKLGNKILLEESINKTIGNAWFKTKTQTSVREKSGYKDSCYSIAASLTTYGSDWRVEDINMATEKAVNRILDFIFGKS